MVMDLSVGADVIWQDLDRKVDVSHCRPTLAGLRQEGRRVPL